MAAATVLAHVYQTSLIQPPDEVLRRALWLAGDEAITEQHADAYLRQILLLNPWDAARLTNSVSAPQSRTRARADPEQAAATPPPPQSDPLPPVQSLRKARTEPPRLNPVAVQPLPPRDALFSPVPRTHELMVVRAKYSPLVEGYAGLDETLLPKEFVATGQQWETLNSDRCPALRFAPRKDPCPGFPITRDLVTYSIVSSKPVFVATWRRSHPDVSTDWIPSDNRVRFDDDLRTLSRSMSRMSVSRRDRR